MYTTRVLTLAALLAGLTAAPASADSIAYVKDGNVRLATPDGSTTVAVTTTGGYSSVSQADDGRMIALHGKRFRLLSRWGDVLADFSPVADGTAGSITLSGPFDPAISPDGTKVAYGFYVQYKSGDPNCGKPGGCQVGQLYTGTGYSKADGPVEWSAAGYRPQYSWTDPSWIDNSRTLLSSPTSAYVKESAIDTAGDGQDAAQWFSEDSLGNLSDGELSRQEQAVAFLGNTQADHLLVYRLPAKPADGGLPQPCLDAPASGKAWSSPSWAPDGEHLAFAGAQGIYVADLTGIGAACPAAASIKVTAFEAGATSPDWGPAGLPGPKPATPASGQDAGASSTPPGSNTATPGGTAASPTLGSGTPGESGTAVGDPPTAIKVSSSSLRAALRRGLRVRVTCSGDRTVRVQARRGKRAVGSGTAKCRKGTAKVSVRFSASAKRALRSATTTQITLTTAGAAPLRVKLR